MPSGFRNPPQDRVKATRINRIGEEQWVSENNATSARSARHATQTNSAGVDLELMRAVARKGPAGLPKGRCTKTVCAAHRPYLMKLLKRHELVDETVNDVAITVPCGRTDRFDPEQDRC